MADCNVSVLVLNPVIEGRASDFERFIRETIVPAVAERRPEQTGKWHVVRARAAENGVVTFGFLFDGGRGADWVLAPVLEEALGAAGAEAAMAEMEGMLAGEQYGWDVIPLTIG